MILREARVGDSGGGGLERSSTAQHSPMSDIARQNTYLLICAGSMSKLPP